MTDSKTNFFESTQCASRNYVQLGNIVKQIGDSVMSVFLEGEKKVNVYSTCLY